MSTLELFAAAAGIAAIVGAVVGWRDLDCPDSNCKSVHRQHVAREREVKQLADHRQLHKHYSAPYCPHCQAEQDEKKRLGR